MISGSAVGDDVSSSSKFDDDDDGITTLYVCIVCIVCIVCMYCMYCIYCIIIYCINACSMLYSNVQIPATSWLNSRCVTCAHAANGSPHTTTAPIVCIEKLDLIRTS